MRWRLCLRMFVYSVNVQAQQASEGECAASSAGVTGSKVGRHSRCCQGVLSTAAAAWGRMSLHSGPHVALAVLTAGGVLI